MLMVKNDTYLKSIGLLVSSVQTVLLSCTDSSQSPNRLKWDSTWPTSPRSSIGCVQNDLRAYGMFGANHAPILRQDYHYLQTDRNELPLEPCHLGVPSGASIQGLLVTSMQTMLLSYTDTNTISKRTEMRFHMTHVTLEFHRVHLKWFMSLWYVRRKLCTYLASRLGLSPNKPKRASTWASSPKSTIGCIQSEPMVRSAQTVHLSCTDNNTISKHTETRFRMTHVT
jgi:hypothetical protein